MGRLAGKVAIITGAARSMGAVEAKLFAREGAAVLVCDILDERGAATAAEITAAGGKARYHRLDVTSEADWKAAAEAAETWGGRIDILVNNAGVNLRGRLMELDLGDWSKVLAVNLTGPLLGCRAVVPAMQRAGGGSIVNISSVSGLRPSASAAYTSSKWGLRGLTRTAAMDLAELGIRVNTVCPTVVPTELNQGQPYIESTAAITPLGRNATAEEVANAVLFLASDESSFITGTDIPVDGGIILGTGKHMTRGVR